MIELLFLSFTLRKQGNRLLRSAIWVVTQLRERSEQNNHPPAMRVDDKKLYKKHLSRLY